MGGNFTLNNFCAIVLILLLLWAALGLCCMDSAVVVSRLSCPKTCGILVP